MLGKLINSAAGTVKTVVETLDTVQDFKQKCSERKEAEKQKKQMKADLSLVKRVDMVIKGRYDLSKEVVFDEDDLLRNPDPDMEYVCVRISLKNTGSKMVSHLRLIWAALTVGDEHSLQDGNESLFMTGKEGEWRTFSLNPDEETDVYFVAREADWDEEDETLDYPALYFILKAEITEKGGNTEEISLEGVYRNNELTKNIE